MRAVNYAAALKVALDEAMRYLPLGDGWQAPDDNDMVKIKEEILSHLTTFIMDFEKTCVLLPADRANVVYIAGPMTGYEEYNFPAFNAVADNLRAQGYTVYNPADHGLIEGAGWVDYLRFDINNLVKCESVFFLPGWSHSNGAMLEYDVAKRLGMKLSFHPKAEVPDECQASLDIQLT